MSAPAMSTPAGNLALSDTAGGQHHDAHIIKYERFDPDAMHTLLRMQDKFSKQVMSRLSQYNKLRDGGNLVRVIYRYGKGLEEAKLGRLFPIDDGLQSFPFDVRNPLLDRNYWDVDIENAHYVFAKKIATELHVATEHISHYINNRDACLKELSANRSIAKTEFLKVLYGGNIKLYSEHFNDKATPEGDTTFISTLKGEMDALMTAVWTAHPELHKLVARKTNKKASLMSLVLQTEERKCLLSLDMFLRSVGRDMDVFIHDGGEVRKLEGEKAFPPELLEQGAAAIFAATGHKVRLTCKPMRHNLEVLRKEPAFKQETVDDEYAARKFVEMLGSNVARDGETVYVFDEETGMWDCSDLAMRSAVRRHKDALTFIVEREDQPPIIHNYGGKERNVCNMLKWVPQAIRDTQFMTKKAHTSLNKLLFSNGIYDFNTGFTEGFNPEIVFTRRIDRPYSEKRNKPLIAEVRKALFELPFDDAEMDKAGGYLLNVLTRSIAGDYRAKKMYAGLGEPNSGKGVMVAAFSSAFGSYVSEFDGNNLKYNERSSQDEAKRLAWIRDLEGVRLAFSSEMRMDKSSIDGNLVKRLASGGDKLLIRGNFENQKSVVLTTTFVALFNDMCPITPCDQAIADRMRYLRFEKRFVDTRLQPELGPDELAGDPFIKDNFHNKAEFQDALVHLVVDNWKKATTATPEPACVIEETGKWIPSGSGIKEALEERYELVEMPADGKHTEWVSAAELFEYISKEKDIRISSTKLGTELAKLGLQKKDKKINKTSVRVWFGISRG
jgi:phage/plasmid-associated DNA primase